MKIIRVICVNPSTEERQKVCGILKTFPLFRLIESFSSMRDARALMEKTAPELLICHEDNGVTDISGYTRDLKRNPEYLILSHDPAVGIRALERGAVFLQYPVTPEKMALALWRAYENLLFKKIQ